MIGVSPGITPSNPIAMALPPDGRSLLLARLAAGQNATLFVNGDQFGGANSIGNSGWMWATANEIVIDHDLSPIGTDLYLHIYPTSDGSPPISNEPLYIQPVIVTEGPLPKGNLTG